MEGNRREPNAVHIQLWPMKSVYLSTVRVHQWTLFAWGQSEGTNELSWRLLGYIRPKYSQLSLVGNCLKKMHGNLKKKKDCRVAHWYNLYTWLQTINFHYYYFIHFQSLFTFCCTFFSSYLQILIFKDAFTYMFPFQRWKFAETKKKIWIINENV